MGQGMTARRSRGRLPGGWLATGAFGYVGFTALGLALEVLALPPGPLPPAVLVADAPFLLLLFHRAGARWKRWALLYGALHFMLAARWLGEVHPVQVLGTGVILAPVYLVFGALICWVAGRGVSLVLVVGCATVIEEMLRTVWCGGMPFPSRAQAFAGESPLAPDALLPAAALFGGYAFCFLAGATSALAALAPLAWLRGERLDRRRLALGASVPLVLVAVLGVHAGARGEDEITELDLGDLLVVQGNVPQSLKHGSEPDGPLRLFNRHILLTQEGLSALAAQGRPVLGVLWPETMIPWSFLDGQLAARFPQAWSNEVGVMRRIRADVPAGRDLPWLVGAIHQFRRGEERHARLGDHGMHDSLFLLDPRAMPDMDAPLPEPRPEVSGWRPPWRRGRHDKVVLVPFGEYTPGGRLFPPLRWLRNRVSPIPELDAGEPDQAPLVIRDRLRAGTVICFDLAFPAPCRDWRRRGAEVLLNASNYGWFGPTGFRSQIQAVARIRAAELAVTVVMAGNTGPTAFYDPLGRRYGTFQDVAGDRMPAGPVASTFREGFVYGPLRVARGPLTPYAKWGDLPWFLLFALVFAWGLVRPWTRRSERSEPGNGALPVPTPGEGIG
jgi:apolipoprotein N-acyltransferase